MLTGFSSMGLDLFTELHKTGKYELFELASYVDDNDPRVNTLPWKVYPTRPAQNTEEWKEHTAPGNTAQFGRARFEKAVLDCKPDIVICHRDLWHDEWIAKSPYRNQFKWIWSTCVDSEPPRADWLEIFNNCDLVTSYTDWGLNVIKKYGPRVKVADINTMPGINTDVFKPLDKKAVRAELGLQDDINIVLTVMRNQPRKLFPNIIASFMNMIDKMHKDNRSEVADKTYLHLHTSLFDIGWDIGKEMLKYNAASKVLLTYCCHQCNHFAISFFKGEKTFCEKCGRLSAITSNTSMGITRENLAKIYNAADLYLQYNIAGALEIPLIEAAACGLPTIHVEYAAPYEISKNPGCFATIPIKYMRQEALNETYQHRGYPDDEELVKALSRYFRLDDNKKLALSKAARTTAEKLYNTKVYAEKWMKLIDNMEVGDPNRWIAPPKLIGFDSSKIPWQLPNAEFVRWAFASLLPPKHYLRGILQEKSLLKQLAYGHDPMSGHQVTKQTVLMKMKEEIDRYNHFELHRYNMLVSQKTIETSKDMVKFKVL